MLGILNRYLGVILVVNHFDYIIGGFRYAKSTVYFQASVLEVWIERSEHAEGVWSWFLMLLVFVLGEVARHL